MELYYLSTRYIKRNVYLLTTPKTQMSVSYQMEKPLFFSPKILNITRRIDKTVVHLNDEAPSKKLSYEVTIRYNLKNNEVNYNYTYILDGKKTQWTSNEFSLSS